MAYLAIQSKLFFNFWWVSGVRYQVQCLKKNIFFWPLPSQNLPNWNVMRVIHVKVLLFSHLFLWKACDILCLLCFSGREFERVNLKKIGRSVSKTGISLKNIFSKVQMDADTGVNICYFWGHISNSEKTFCIYVAMENAWYCLEIWQF